MTMTNNFIRGLRRFVRDDRGAEMAEWVVVSALVTAVAAILYTGILQSVLIQGLSYIGIAAGNP